MYLSPMPKVEIKTRRTEGSVEDFLAAVPDEQQRSDSRVLLDLMRRISGAPPKLWGPAIIGFGSVPLKYASGRELDWFMCGFSPRKGKLSIYLTCDIASYGQHLQRLGKHSVGKGCLYVKRLSDVDMRVLEELVREAVRTPWV